jgi:hypothetical protein
MLIVPIIALIYIGGSYFAANRFLPPNLAMKAVPWMAGVAFAAYYVTQFLAAVIAGVLFGPSVIDHLAVFIAISFAGSVVAAGVVLRIFVRRHRRRKADREAQAAVF